MSRKRKTDGADLPEWAESSKDFPANVKFVGRRRELNKETGEWEPDKEVPAAEVPTWRRNGDRVLTLPDGATQKKGFWHSDAAFLLKAYRDEFKSPVDKAGNPVTEENSDEHA